MRRELVATIGDTERAVYVEPHDGGSWRVIVGDTEHIVDAVEIRPGTWSILIEGRSHLVDLDARKTGTTALVGGIETRLVVEDARRKRLAEAVGVAGGDGSGETILAPIAGKVVKILVSVGDEVAAGQPVAVLEAMKMENELQAERGGKVASVDAVEGASIEAGDRLLVLE